MIGRYPGRVFDYETARLALEATSVEVKGTGDITRAALRNAPDLFERLPRQKGQWRWK